MTERQEEHMDLIHPTLYILMRTDLDSLNPGKAMAQAAHAADAMRNAIDVAFTNHADSYDAWRNDTKQGFGTTIVLGAPIEKIENAIDTCFQMGYPALMVNDPTYPVRDGMVTHLIPVNTCGAVFTPCRIGMPLYPLIGLELHP